MNSVAAIGVVTWAVLVCAACGLILSSSVGVQLALDWTASGRVGRFLQRVLRFCYDFKRRAYKSYIRRRSDMDWNRFQVKSDVERGLVSR